jgi:hypothetical protein
VLFRLFQLVRVLYSTKLGLLAQLLPAALKLQVSVACIASNPMTVTPADLQQTRVYAGSAAGAFGTSMGAGLAGPCMGAVQGMGVVPSQVCSGLPEHLKHTPSILPQLSGCCGAVRPACKGQFACTLVTKPPGTQGTIPIRISAT